MNLQAAGKKTPTSRVPALALAAMVLILFGGGYGIFILTSQSSHQTNEDATTVSTTALQSRGSVTVDIVRGAVSDRSSGGFSPGIVTVALGVNNTVAWKNNDMAPHTVTASDGSFASGNLNVGETYSRIFSEPGNYSYICDYHPWMNGTVVVTYA